MIAERTNGVQTTSTIVGQSYQAGIDDEDMAKIITMFTDMYSDPIKAVIREYSTNAHDAQVEAGIVRPIDVQTPTSLSPFFRVQDWGVGLDAENIGRVYSRYGKSTKDKSNDQNGMFGIGCKAALTYTEQFTVESVKNGMRTICSIAREDHGVPVFTVVASVPDSGPNGTTVIVPVARHQHADFERKAKELYSYWPAGSVILNGREPAKVADGALHLTNDIMLVKRESYYYRAQQIYVVMGNVAYPVESEHLRIDLPSNYYAVIQVPIGSVTLPPARESLMYTKLTKETLADIPQRYSAALETAIKRKVEAASSHREALKIAFEWRDLLGNSVKLSRFTYKGAHMPETVPGVFTLVASNARKLSASQTSSTGLHIDYLRNATIVVGYDAVNFTATHKRKLLQYADDHNPIQPDYFVLCRIKPDMTWLEDSQIIQWDDVKAVKLPRAVVTRSGRPTGSYDVFMPPSEYSTHTQAADLDDSEPIYYSRGRNSYETQAMAIVIRKAQPTAQIVCLPENRYAKFMRNFPAARCVRSGTQEAYDAWAKALTNDQRLAMAMHDNGARNELRRFDAAKVDDPEFAKAVRLAQSVNVGPLIDDRKVFNQVMHVVSTVVDNWTDPREKYTLISHVYISDESLPHLYIYMNAVHAAGDTP